MGAGLVIIPSQIPSGDQRMEEQWGLLWEVGNLTKSSASLNIVQRTGIVLLLSSAVFMPCLCGFPKKASWSLYATGCGMGASFDLILTLTFLFFPMYTLTI